MQPDMSAFFGGGQGSGGLFEGGGASGMDKGYSLLSGIIQANARRKQGALKSALNAQTMKYSPWTGLAGSSMDAQQKNMEYVPGEDMSKTINETLGMDKKQAAANQKNAENKMYNSEMLRLMQGKDNDGLKNAELYNTMYQRA